MPPWLNTFMRKRWYNPPLFVSHPSPRTPHPSTAYDLATASLASSGLLSRAFCDWWYRPMRVHWMTPTTPRKKLTAARLHR